MHVFSFYISIILILYLTIKKYDDVGFIGLKRPLTVIESFQRILYVVAKCFASINGGGFFAEKFYLLFIKGKLSISLDEMGFFLLQLIMITSFFGTIGLSQNVIRRFQRRQLRPIVDTAIIRFNVQNWPRRR